MAADEEKEEFKSPPRKLIAFFEKSRDQWKSKFAKAKKDLKRLENRVRFLEKGKAKWKVEAKRLQAEAARVKEQIPEQRSKPEVDVAKKNLNNR
jgi:chromosome segregation ATPase